MDRLDVPDDVLELIASSVERDIAVYSKAR